MVVSLETVAVATTPVIPCSISMAHPSTISFCSQPTTMVSLPPDISPFIMSAGHVTHSTPNPLALNILNPLIITPSSWKQS